MGTAIVAPNLDPLLNVPEAKLRSRFGNHLLTTLEAEGYEGASDAPITRRTIKALIKPVVSASAEVDKPQITLPIPNTFLGPTISTSRPPGIINIT